MPTFSAVTLDRFLEPGALKSKASDLKLEKKNKSVSDKKIKQPQVSPSLYTTPETTSLPDSPFSYPPSPYVINHKRRGPNLQKIYSQTDVLECVEEEKGDDETERNSDEQVSRSIEDVSFKAKLSNFSEEVDGSGVNGGKVENSNGLCGKNDSPMIIGSVLERENVYEDFFDPHESLSVTSITDGEDNICGDRSFKLSTPMGEFFDACEGTFFSSSLFRFFFGGFLQLLGVKDGIFYKTLPDM